MSAFATTWLRSDRSVANVRSMERPAERNWPHRWIWLALLLMLLVSSTGRRAGCAGRERVVGESR
jgi:hypothetical protein